MQYLLHPAVQKFIVELPTELQNKVAKQLMFLEKFGRLLPPPDSKKISKNLLELRVAGRVQVRLLYGFVDDMAIVVHGFVKKSQKIPRRDIELAHRRFREVA